MIRRKEPLPEAMKDVNAVRKAALKLGWTEDTLHALACSLDEGQWIGTMTAEYAEILGRPQRNQRQFYFNDPDDTIPAPVGVAHVATRNALAHGRFAINSNALHTMPPRKVRST